MNEETRRLLQQGFDAQTAGDNATALTHYLQALPQAADIPELHNNLGAVRLSLKQYDEAIISLNNAIKLQPDYWQAWNNLSKALRLQGNLDAARVAVGTALHLNSQGPGCLMNLGLLEMDCLNFDAAINAFSAVLQIDPSNPSAWVNLGETHTECQQFETAVSCFNQALQIDPTHPEARWNHALHLLASGNWNEGWQKHESRWDLPDQVYRHTSLPTWNGENLQGPLLIWVEQGFGDTLQFLRYLSLLKNRNISIWIEVHAPLVTLAQSLPGVDRVFSLGASIPVAAAQIPLHSLPKIFSTTRETIPSPLLWTDPAKLHPTTLTSPQKPWTKIGFCWQGSAVDLRRRIPLDEWKQLWDLPHIEWISFQTGDVSEDLARTGFKGRSLHHQLTDFSHTAQALREVDGVISIDTALAHLAGATGTPLWVLLPKVPDWRWGWKNETQTPWYPNARLFRQTNTNSWTSVFEEVLKALTTTAK